MAIIRPSRLEDIPGILGVIQAAFAQYRGLLDPPSSAEHKTLAIVAQELETAEALVAEHDRQVVGCAFHRPRGDSVYLDRLAVAPEHRRQGLGHQLMMEVERRALETGHRKVTLAVRLPLRDLQTYYRRQGYVAIGYGTHPGYPTHTYVNMEKQL